MSKILMRFTGVGGQGVLLAGAIFAAAKINAGGYGLKTATYTSQVRGGATVVDITLDDKEILYPYANDGEIDFMLSVAQVSYDQFKNGVKKRWSNSNRTKPSKTHRRGQKKMENLRNPNHHNSKRRSRKCNHPISPSPSNC